MTRDEIISMAREADLYLDGANQRTPMWVLTHEELIEFATLVAARKRKQVYASILRGLRSENDSPQLRAIIASVEADCVRADNEVMK